MSSAQPRSGERPSRQYLFGEFTLDLGRGLLRRGSEEVPLRAKSFAVLTYMVEHHGQMVAKSALIEAVWPNTAVGDNSLAQCLFDIRRALGDDSQQVIRTVARRGYLFAAPVTMQVVELPPLPAGAEALRAPVPVSPAILFPASPPFHHRGLLICAIALIAFAAGTALLSSSASRLSRARETTEPLRAMPLNSLPGVQRYPSFSPDGNHVTFTWTGPRQDNQDVYIQQISSGSQLRLTTDPRIDYNPVWSPDGRWIAFLRRQWGSGSSELLLIPPLGGLERKLAEIRISNTYYINPPYQTWCPDSSCLIVTDSAGKGKPDGLVVISLDAGQARPLTRPQFPAIGDTNPAVSADGSWLVFRRQNSLHSGELYRLQLRRSPASRASADATGLSGVGEPRRLTPPALDARYPTWIPGNSEIVFSARGSLWRLAVPGKNTLARLPFAGEDGIMPVFSPLQSGGVARLVYVRTYQDSNIWRIRTSASGAVTSAPPVLAISSTGTDSTPQLSPNGRRVAFVSRRLGRAEIWLADPDGSRAVQLTFMDAVSAGAPCWSPDGERIVFQSNFEGQLDVYIISAAGGKPLNLTSHPASDWRPSFSQDGQWIYFTSNRTGQRQIWKVPASGGDAVQVTNNVAFAAFESPDAAYLYYNETMETPSPLWCQPVSGGIPIKVLDGVVRAAFTVLKEGIYYIDQPSSEGGLLDSDQVPGETRLRYFDFATRRTATVARNLGNVSLGLTASKDGRTIFYSRVDSSMDDLMLVENFR